MKYERISFINSSATTAASNLTESAKLISIIRDINHQLKDHAPRRLTNSLVNSSQSSRKLQRSSHRTLDKVIMEMPSASFSRLKVNNFSSTIRGPFTQSNSSQRRQMNTLFSSPPREMKLKTNKTETHSRRQINYDNLAMKLKTIIKQISTLGVNAHPQATPCSLSKRQRQL
jgi:hypothetical protein